MGSVKQRYNKLYIVFTDASGKRVERKTGLDPSQRKQAMDVLRQVEASVRAGQHYAPSGAPITVQMFFEAWITRCRQAKLRSVRDYDTRIRKHALPSLGQLRIDQVSTRHILNLMDALHDLAPRTRLHVYRTLSTMFRRAVREELISRNPCCLDRKELPKKVDKDPTWRSRAIFTRKEVIRLLSDSRIPEERRVLYAIAFFTGCRFGEAAALRWNRYDEEREPLGCLLIADSFDTKTKTVGPLKTEVPREVPVHAELARVLARWKSTGWPRIFGRQPLQDDLLIPYPPMRGEFNAETHWRADTCWKRLNEDLELLGFRHRRTHDSRRTLISLARADGANKDVLQWATHGRPEGIINAYSEFPWETLCAEFAKLKIAVETEDSPQNRDAQGKVVKEEASTPLLATAVIPRPPAALRPSAVLSPSVHSRSLQDSVHNEFDSRRLHSASPEVSTASENLHLDLHHAQALADAAIAALDRGDVDVARQLLLQIRARASVPEDRTSPDAHSES